VCSGLHPSQQLMKYDGEVAAAGIQNDVAQRLSSQGSGGSGDAQHGGIMATLSDAGSDDALPPTDHVHVEAEKPISDLSNLYAKPSRVIGRRQVEAESSADGDQIAAYPYEDADSRDRKPSLTGYLPAPSFLFFTRATLC